MMFRGEEKVAKDADFDLQAVKSGVDEIGDEDETFKNAVVKVEEGKTGDGKDKEKVKENKDKEKKVKGGKGKKTKGDLIK